MNESLDPRFTFASYVVGSSNRLAAAAARRAAESPGNSYNPLVLYGGPGLGKTHLLHAIGHHALSVRPDLRIVHETMEAFIGRIAAGTASGTYHFQDEHLEIDLLLLDGVHTLAGRGPTQAEMLWIWDAMVAAGSQVVLVSDRPPAEVDGLDQRLISQFSGGLIVDLGAPTLDTRAEIVRRRATEAGISLADGVAEALVRLSFDDTAELERRLERLIARQRERGVAIPPAEVFAASAPEAEPPETEEEFSSFLEEITSTVATVVEGTPWRNTLAAAILRWEGEGIRTLRLEQAMHGEAPADAEQMVAAFAADVERLRGIQQEIASLNPQRASASVFQDPDAVDEAESLLRAIRSAALPLPPLQQDARAEFGARPDRDPGGTPRSTPPGADAWFFNPEKVAWSWLALRDRLIEDLG